MYLDWIYNDNEFASVVLYSFNENSNNLINKLSKISELSNDNNVNNIYYYTNNIIFDF